MLHPNLVISSDERASSKAPNGSDAIDVQELIEKFGAGENSVGESKVYAEGVLANLGQEEDAECPICFDVMETPAILPECMHQWYVMAESCASGTIDLTTSCMQLQGLHRRLHRKVPRER